MNIAAIGLRPTPAAAGPRAAEAAQAPADVFTPAAAAPRTIDAAHADADGSPVSRLPAAVAPTPAETRVVGERYAAVLSPTLPGAFRGPIVEALDALPPEVTAALERSGYQIAVATQDGPPPFGFTPYPIDTLAARASQVAHTPPKPDQRFEVEGARVITQRCDPYMTFDDLARQRGATTDDEVAEMAALARALNPTLEVRGELPMGHQMYIPDYYYWRGQRVPTAAWVAITQEAQGIAGTTFDKRIPYTDAPQKLILMSESAFHEATPLARFYLHHEIGHAVVDILNQERPAFGTDLQRQMGERMRADKEARTLLRPYSGSEPDEFIADAFAARFLAAPPQAVTEEEKRQASLCSDTLRARDPQAWQLAAAMVTELPPGNR